jgi:hypothetical protein
MRNLVIGFAIIVIALVFAAMPILFTGKSALFTLAAGHPHASARATTIAAMLAAACAAAWMILGLAAHRYPRKYYPLQAWRRRAIWLAGGSLVFALGSVLWRQVVYGAAL